MMLSRQWPSVPNPAPMLSSPLPSGPRWRRAATMPLTVDVPHPSAAATPHMPNLPRPNTAQMVRAVANRISSHGAGPARFSKPPRDHHRTTSNPTESKGSTGDHAPCLAPVTKLVACIRGFLGCIAVSPVCASSPEPAKPEDAADCARTTAGRPRTAPTGLGPRRLPSRTRGPGLEPPTAWSPRRPARATLRGAPGKQALDTPSVRVRAEPPRPQR